MTAAAPLISAAATGVPDNITIGATGDCILTRPVSKLKQPQFLKLVEILRGADCLYGNCEMVLADPESGGHPMPEGAALSVVSDAKIADELAWMGFDIMGTANNHTWDFGVPGISATRANLKRVGITSAGSGLDLQQAAAPRYAWQHAGRPFVALRSIARRPFSGLCGRLSIAPGHQGNSGIESGASRHSLSAGSCELRRRGDVQDG